MLNKSQFLLLALISITSLAAQAVERIRVLNQGLMPIAGAEVTIGSPVKSPGNILITDKNGYINVPADWKAALPITVSATGFITSRFEQVLPKSATLQIHEVDPQTLIEIGGETVGFENLKKDGLVDFALVYPTMSRRQLMQFSVTDLVSPETDQIKVITQKVDLPSNITLPEQKETYILPITLKKPLYRAFVKPDADYTMTATHGQFPIKEVLGEMQNGKSFFDVMNYFTFIDFGQFNVSVQKTKIPNQNIAVNLNKIDGKMAYTAPSFGKDQVLLAAALVEQNGAFYPSDLKRLDSLQKMDLSIPTLAKSTYIASVLMPKTTSAAFDAKMKNWMLSQTNPMAHFFNQLTEGLSTQAALPGVTLHIQKAPVTKSYEFIGLTQPPEVVGTQLKLTIPTLPAQVTPVATYVVLAEIEAISMGQYKSEKRYRKLEFFSESWIDSIEIPDLSKIVVSGKKYRWEVMYLGRDSNLKPGSYFLDEITHVSRHALDF